MKLKFATTNKEKVKEANKVGKEHGIKFEQLSLDWPEPRSDQLSLIVKKGATYCFKKIKKPLVTEDSGLFIEELNGFPGSYSAYVFDKIGLSIRKLLGKNRKALFRCSVAYKDQERLKVFEGHVKGKIAREAKGKFGFGYDPVFIPKGYKMTFAESPTIKIKLSHRTKAFRKLCKWLTS